MATGGSRPARASELRPQAQLHPLLTQLRKQRDKAGAEAKAHHLEDPGGSAGCRAGNGAYRLTAACQDQVLGWPAQRCEAGLRGGHTTDSTAGTAARPCLCLKSDLTSSGMSVSASPPPSSPPTYRMCSTEYSVVMPSTICRGSRPRAGRGSRVGDGGRARAMQRAHSVPDLRLDSLQLPADTRPLAPAGPSSGSLLRPARAGCRRAAARDPPGRPQ